MAGYSLADVVADAVAPTPEELSNLNVDVADAVYASAEALTRKMCEEGQLAKCIDYQFFRRHFPGWSTPFLFEGMATLQSRGIMEVFWTLAEEGYVPQVQCLRLIPTPNVVASILRQR